MKYSSIVSPGLCFLLLQKETHNQNTERYYLNLLMIVLRRHYKYKTLDEALDFFINKETDEEVAVVLAELICVFSNYCKYMTDKVQITFVKDLPTLSTTNEFKYAENDEHDELIREHHSENEKKNINKTQNSVDNDNSEKTPMKIANEQYFQRRAIELHLEEFDPEYAKNVAEILVSLKHQIDLI